MSPSVYLTKQHMSWTLQWVPKLVLVNQTFSFYCIKRQRNLVEEKAFILMMFATDCIWCLPGGMCGCGVDTKGHLGLRQSEGMCINALRQDDVCKQGSTIVKIVCSFTCLTICSAFQTSVIIFPGWRSPWLFFNYTRRRVDVRQVEPRGGWGWSGGRAFGFVKIVWYLATGACSLRGVSPSMVDSSW